MQRDITTHVKELTAELNEFIRIINHLGEDENLELVDLVNFLILTLEVTRDKLK